MASSETLMATLDELGAGPWPPFISARSIHRQPAREEQVEPEQRPQQRDHRPPPPRNTRRAIIVKTHPPRISGSPENPPVVGTVPSNARSRQTDFAVPLTGYQQVNASKPAPDVVTVRFRALGVGGGSVE